MKLFLTQTYRKKGNKDRFCLFIHRARMQVEHLRHPVDLDHDLREFYVGFSVTHILEDQPKWHAHAFNEVIFENRTRDAFGRPEKAARGF